MGSLAEALVEAAPRIRRPNLVDAIIDGLDDGDRVALLTSMQSRKPSWEIADALTAHGHPVSESSVTKWRAYNVAR